MIRVPQQSQESVQVLQDDEGPYHVQKSGGPEEFLFS